jgi:hypothetical protein
MNSDPQETQRLREQVEGLTREVDLLRGQLSPESANVSPTFNPMAFQREFQYYMRWMGLIMPFFFLIAFTPLLMRATGWRPNRLGPLMLFDFAGMYGGGMPGIGLAWISFGGLSAGLIAVGGMAFGGIAIGGGAVGILAIGGSAVGIFAWGGCAVGIVAVGGGAVGYYALASKAVGKYVFSLRRQDEPAVEFFTRYLPRLRKAITRPLPVVPINP